MEIVDKHFFIRQKIVFYFEKKNYSSKFLGCVRDRTQVTKPIVYSKLESPKGWSSGIYNALETAWIV